MCTMFWMHVCLCTAFMPGSHRGQKKVLDALNLELETILSYHVGIRN